MTERALTTIAAEIAGEDEGPDQFSLFAAPLTEAGRKAAAKRGVGRPPGARNKRTERSVAWLLSRYRDPVEGLLEVAQTSAYDLQAMYGGELTFWMTEKRLCALGAAPFVKAKITPEIVDNRQVIHMHFGAAEGDAGAGGERVTVLDPEEYQRVSDGASDEV